MKIVAFSDNHGYLPLIEQKADLLCICGDWSPLEIQNNFWEMKQWIEHIFIPYLQEIPVNKIVLIAGNHDFICDYYHINSFMLNVPRINFNRDIFIPILRKHKLTKKISYLENSILKYCDLKIYGCPYVENLSGWAFSNASSNQFNLIKKCDILLTHQPPLVNNIGSLFYNERKYEFGSICLLDRIKQIKPRINLCGHIHDGSHELFKMRLCSDYDSLFMNVSIKNNDCEINHTPFMLEI